MHGTCMCVYECMCIAPFKIFRISILWKIFTCTYPHYYYTFIGNNIIPFIGFNYDEEQIFLGDGIISWLSFKFCSHIDSFWYIYIYIYTRISEPHIRIWYGIQILIRKSSHKILSKTWKNISNTSDRVSVNEKAIIYDVYDRFLRLYVYQRLRSIEDFYGNFSYFFLEPTNL